MIEEEGVLDYSNHCCIRKFIIKEKKKPIGQRVRGHFEEEKGRTTYEETKELIAIIKHLQLDYGLGWLMDYSNNCCIGKFVVK